jgi:predicted secreted protein
VLPLWVTPPNATTGHARGAPQRPRMLLKVAVTTCLGAIWLGIYVWVSSPWFSFRGS